MTAIRPRTDADIAACTRILAAVHNQLGYPVNWPEDPGDWLAGDPAWVAVSEDGEVRGQVSVRDLGADVLIERLFVDPAYGGRGIGRALLRHALEAVRTRGQVILDVVAADDAANALYRSEGWTVVSHKPIDWGRDPAAKLVRYRAPAA